MRKDFVVICRFPFVASGGVDGKIIVSVYIPGITALPNSKITQYTNFLSQRMPMSIKPIFINPLFTYIKVVSLVRYNTDVTTNSVNYIKTLVSTTSHDTEVVNTTVSCETTKYYTFLSSKYYTKNAIILFKL